MPARPTDRVFFVRVWGELRPVTELPPLLIVPRPFVMQPYDAPTYGPDPGPGWGLRLSRAAEPPSVPGAVMASAAPRTGSEPLDSLPDAPDPALLREVVASLRGRAARCYETTMVPGTVELLITVEGESGSVRTARATGADSISRCIERAAGALRFPAFARASISIQQTYAFR